MHGWLSVFTKSGPLVVRTRAEQAEDTHAWLRDHCQRLLAFTEPSCLPPRMTSYASEWLQRSRGIAADTLVWLGACSHIRDVEVGLRHGDLYDALAQFYAESRAPWRSNRFL